MPTQAPPVPPSLQAPLGPWPMPNGFDNRWPGPLRPAAPQVVGALVFAALVAAVSVPLTSGGVGWLVAAVAGAGALTVARLVPSGPPPSAVVPALTPRTDPLRPGWIVATVALVGVGTVRSAGWLVVLCLVAAVPAGAVAIIGGRSTASILRALSMALLAGFPGVRWLSQGVARLGRNRVSGLRLAATAAVTVALLAVFGGLLASADGNFARMLTRAVPESDGGSTLRWLFVFVTGLFVLSGAAYLVAAPPDHTERGTTEVRRVARLEWAIPLALLGLLFALFVAVQLTVLFGGSQHVLETDGLTYANYARGGFWQLLMVTGLTLLVLAGAARWAPRDTRADRVTIRAVLGALAVLTLIIVASSMHRMYVYSDTYGLTRLRLLVAVCELCLGVVFVLVLAAGVKLRGEWLPRAVLAVGVLALLGLAAVNPDALIAERNVTRYAETGRIDTAYLATLSADAVPELVELPWTIRDCTLRQAYLDHDDDWRSWSYGRAVARQLLDGTTQQFPAVCP